MNIAHETDGVLILNKHAGPTSHDIVNMIRKLYHTKKVGHTGTLDPMASGVLVILIGRAAKAAEYLVSDTKKYETVLRLGITTNTEDITGEPLSVYEGELPSESRVISTALSCVGKSLQVPPMYSALKVDGKKLVDLARQGIEIERASRHIEIFSLDCKKMNSTDYSLSVHCSSGTYIRTLCQNIGEKLGCGGAMASLHRTETGGFSIENSYTVDQLKEMDETQLASILIPIEVLFSSLPKINLTAFFEKLCRSGCEIYQKKIKTSFSEGTRVRLCSEDGEFFALGEVREYEKGSALKAIKTFKI